MARLGRSVVEYKLRPPAVRGVDPTGAQRKIATRLVAVRTAVEQVRHAPHSKLRPPAVRGIDPTGAQRRIASKLVSLTPGGDRRQRVQSRIGKLDLSIFVAPPAALLAPPLEVKLTAVRVARPQVRSKLFTPAFAPVPVPPTEVKLARTTIRRPVRSKLVQLNPVFLAVAPPIKIRLVATSIRPRRTQWKLTQLDPLYFVVSLPAPLKLELTAVRTSTLGRSAHAVLRDPVVVDPFIPPPPPPTHRPIRWVLSRGTLRS